MKALDIGTMMELKESYTGWVEEFLKELSNGFQPKWTKSIAVGSVEFVEKIKTELGSKTIGREIAAVDGACELREPVASYNANFAGKNSGLRSEKTHFWNIS